MSDDIFRRNYGAPTQEKRDQADAIKAKAGELLQMYLDAEIDSPEDYREDTAEKCHHRAMVNRPLHVARTRLEESVMWAVKGVMTEVPRG